MEDGTIVLTVCCSGYLRRKDGLRRPLRFRRQVFGGLPLRFELQSLILYLLLHNFDGVDLRAVDLEAIRLERVRCVKRPLVALPFVVPRAARNDAVDVLFLSDRSLREGDRFGVRDDVRLRFADRIRGTRTSVVR